MPSQEALDAIQAIVAKCSAAQADLDNQRSALEDQIQTIESPNPPRGLTDAELAQIDKLNAAIDALSDLDDQLSVDEAEQLNDSDAAKSLADDIKSSNGKLKDAIAAVQKTAQRLQDLAKFIQQIDGIAQNLIKLSTLLA